MNNPFRSKLWQKSIKQNSILTHNEFCVSSNDANGTWVKLDEINEMITRGILTVDYETLEQYILDKTVIIQ